MRDFNFFNWHPRLQGFMLGVLAMTIAAVIDSLRTGGCHVH